jgi:predicted ferric reductase
VHFLTCAFIPFAISLIRFVPVPYIVENWVNGHLIYPSLFGKYRSTPLPYKIGNAPTRAQSIFIFYMVAINVILCAVGYGTNGPTSSQQMVKLIGTRIGHIALSNFPLLILYSSRNNILLWVTDWSHSTFLILHKWVGRILMLQVLVHGMVYFHSYIQTGELSRDEAERYWRWGAVAAVGLAIIVSSSIILFRKNLYEIFLVTHIVFAAIIVSAAYRHVVDDTNYRDGYEIWLYLAMGIWGLDRMLRMLRLLRNGVKKATITVIDDEYIRIDVRRLPITGAGGPANGGHAYLYFPTLTWRVWENHPFSIMTTFPVSNGEDSTYIREKLGQVERLGSSSEDGSSGGVSSSASDEKKTLAKISDKEIEIASPISTASSSFPSSPISVSGTSSPSREKFTPAVYQERGETLSVFIRTQSGLTRYLRKRTVIPILVEGFYGHSTHNELAAVRSYRTLIAIAGGVGISAVIPFLRAHDGPNTQLFWGCRTPGLVNAVIKDDIGPHVQVSTTVGDRMDLAKVLGDVQGDVAVVVCGPTEMADDVRALVAGMARDGGRRVRLIEESFSW